MQKITNKKAVYPDEMLVDWLGLDPANGAEQLQLLDSTLIAAMLQYKSNLLIADSITEVSDSIDTLAAAVGEVADKLDTANELLDEMSNQLDSRGKPRQAQKMLFLNDSQSRLYHKIKDEIEPFSVNESDLLLIFGSILQTHTSVYGGWDAD